MKFRSEAPPCGACGRPVGGYVPSPGGEGTPCCSVECARVLWLRDKLAATERERDDARAELAEARARANPPANVSPKVIGPTADEVIAAPLMTCGKCGRQEIGIARAPARPSAPIPWGWYWLLNDDDADEAVCERCGIAASERAGDDVECAAVRLIATMREVDPELMTAEAEEWRRKFRELQARHRTAIGLLTDAERSLEAIRAFLTSENAR